MVNWQLRNINHQPEEKATMRKDYTKKLGNVIEVNESQIQDHLGELVRGTVEETINAMLDAEADALCNAARYERSEARKDTRAGYYKRDLHTKASGSKGVAEGAKEDKAGWLTRSVSIFRKRCGSAAPFIFIALFSAWCPKPK